MRQDATSLTCTSNIVVSLLKLICSDELSVVFLRFNGLDCDQFLRCFQPQQIASASRLKERGGKEAAEYQKNVNLCFFFAAIEQKLL